MTRARVRPLTALAWRADAPPGPRLVLAARTSAARGLDERGEPQGADGLVWDRVALTPCRALPR